MSRYIFCPVCASGFNLHPEDEANGFKIRKKLIRAKVPEDGSHVIIVKTYGPVATEDVTPVPIVVCDGCNDELTAKPAVAVDLYQGEEPEQWWEKYHDETNEAGSQGNAEDDRQ